MLKKNLKKIFEKIKRLIKKIFEILSKPDMAVLPGQIAFSTILSLVPIITLIGYGASLFDISMDSIVEIIENSMGSNIANLVEPIITGKTLDFTIIIMLIVMFYFASNGPASIIFSANQIYEINQTSWIKRRLKAIGLTLLIVVLYLFLLIFPAFGELLIDAIDYFNIKPFLTNILEILHGPISWIIIFFFIKVIFTISPNKKIPSSRINIGACFTTIGWIIATRIYSFYVAHFARYDLFYAGLSNIAVLMLWIYFLSYILVVGLSLTADFEKSELAKTGKIELN